MHICAIRIEVILRNNKMRLRSEIFTLLAHFLRRRFFFSSNFLFFAGEGGGGRLREEIYSSYIAAGERFLQFFGTSLPKTAIFDVFLHILVVGTMVNANALSVKLTGYFGASGYGDRSRAASIRTRGTVQMPYVRSASGRSYGRRRRSDSWLPALTSTTTSKKPTKYSCRVRYPTTKHEKTPLNKRTRGKNWVKS